jgi:hypothetical protein
MSAMKCPNCGEPVSQFAAGCAVCGADLEKARAQRAQRRQLPRPPSVGRRLPLYWWLLPMTALVALVFPLAGVVIAFLAGRRADLDGERGMRNAYIAVAVIAIAVLAIPDLRYGVLELVYG